MGPETVLDTSIRVPKMAPDMVPAQTATAPVPLEIKGMR